MADQTTFSRISARAARVPKARFVLLGAIVLLFATGVGIGRWQRAGAGAGSVHTTTLAPEVGGTTVQPSRVITDCPCAIPALGGVPLEAFANGCPCDLPTTSGVQVDQWPASTRLEAFPTGCPCVLPPQLPTAAPTSR